MMATNDALMEKQNISRTSHVDKEIVCASWIQIGGRGKKYVLY